MAAEVVFLRPIPEAEIERARSVRALAIAAGVELAEPMFDLDAAMRCRLTPAGLAAIQAVAGPAADAPLLAAAADLAFRRIA